MRLALCLHDGLYSCGTGAGFANWRFIQCLQRCRHLVDELFVLPVWVAATSGEFDGGWCRPALRLLGELSAQVLPVDNGTAGQRRYGGMREWAAASEDAARRIRTIAAGGIWVVGFDTPFAGLLGLLSDDPRIRQIHVPLSTGLLHSPGDRARAVWERRNYARADGRSALLGAISAFMRSHLAAEYGVRSRGLVDVFQGPTRFEWTHQTRPCPLELTDQRFILCYGRGQPYKGQHLLVEALSLLRSSGTPPPLAVIGAVSESASNEYADRIERRCRQAGIEAVVVRRFNLWLRDLIGHPSLAAVVVPSLSEPYGRIPMECYTHPSFAGVVVASMAGGLAETVVPGETGFGFAPGSAESLATALRHALACPRAERLAMKARALTRIQARYSYEHNVHALLQRLHGHA